MAYTTKQKDIDLSMLQEGSKMPWSEELEKDVLGTIIFFGNKSMEDVSGILKPSTFYDGRNSIIYKSLMEMAERNDTISLVNLAEHMRSNGTLTQAGDVLYLSQISNNSYTSVELNKKASRLREYEMKRDLLFLSLRVASDATTPESEVNDVMATIEKGLSQINTGEDKNAVDIDDALHDFYDYLMRVQSGEEQNVYTSTGFKKLDEVLNGGFYNSNLIVFGGRPGNFKTSLAIAFAKSAIRQQRKVLFVNIEMSQRDIVTLLVAEGVNANHLQQGKLTPEELNQVEWNMSRIMGSGLSISCRCNTYNSIVSLARSTKRKKGLDMLIVDYLGLIEAGINKERRQLEIAYMTRGLKALSKELDIPILLLSQLRRPMPGETVYKPRLEDLRESGDIEQDADVVIFTHRPDPSTADSTGRLWYNRGMFVIAKNRRGSRDAEIPYAHDPFCKRFVDDGEDDPAWGCGDYMAYSAFADKFKVDSNRSINAKD